MEKREKEFVWQLIMVIFSVTLFFSLNNAFEVNLFKFGDWIYYMRGIKPHNWVEIKSTALYIFLIIINVLILGCIYQKWEYLITRWCKRINLYINLMVGMALGISPMGVYYIMVIIAETFYPQIFPS